MGYSYSGDPTNYPSAITLPQGSDLKNVSTVDVPFEGLCDRTAFLEARANDLHFYSNDTNSGGDPALVETFEYDVIGTTWTKSSVVLVDIPSCAAFDQLFCKLHIGGMSSSGGSGVPSTSYRLYVIQDYGGAALQSAVPASHAVFGLDSNDADNFLPMSCMGRKQISTNGTCRVGLEMRLRLASSGFETAIYSGIFLEVQRVIF